MKSIPPQIPDRNRAADSDLTLRRGIRPLLLLTSIFFLNFLARVVHAPLMPEIEADLGISHGTAGSMFFLISAGYFIALVGSGWIAARITHRQTIILSVVLIGMALAGIALGQGLETLRGAFFVLGLAAGLYLPSAIATLTSLITARRWGQALAVHELAPNLAFVLAPLLSELLLLRFSWRGVVAFLSAAAILFGILYARIGRGGGFTGAAPHLAAFKRFAGDPAFWIMALLFGLGISSTLGVFTMLPLYLVNDHGIERDLANTVVALSRISGLFMALVGGWATDRFGPRVTMMAAFLSTGTATIIMGIASGAWVLVIVFLQPLTAVCFFPAGFAALSRIGPPDARNIAVSLAVPLGFLIGGGAVPLLIGTMGDALSFAAGLALVGGGIAAGALPAYFLRLRPSG